MVVTLLSMSVIGSNTDYTLGQLKTTILSSMFLCRIIRGAVVLQFLSFVLSSVLIFM